MQVETAKLFFVVLAKFQLLDLENVNSRWKQISDSDLATLKSPEAIPIPLLYEHGSKES